MAGTFWISVVARMKMTCAGGSSSVFSSALKAAVDSMCTSSMIYTLYWHPSYSCFPAKILYPDDAAHLLLTHTALLPEQVVIDYYEEERRFKEFSEKALNIRNNECDTEEFAEFTKSVAENLPSRSLYPLQLLSAYHMAFSQNACNFSVPGAGKTSIVYGAYAYLHNLPEDNPKHVDQLLIVGPLSSFGPWETEFAASVRT